MNKQTRNKAYPKEFREQVVKLAQDGDELGPGDAPHALSRSGLFDAQLGGLRDHSTAIPATAKKVRNFVDTPKQCRSWRDLHQLPTLNVSVPLLKKAQHINVHHHEPHSAQFSAGTSLSTACWHSAMHRRVFNCVLVYLVS